MLSSHAMEILLRNFTSFLLLEDLQEVLYRLVDITQMLSGTQITTEMELYDLNAPFPRTLTH
jgi:hypothetical protein